MHVRCEWKNPSSLANTCITTIAVVYIARVEINCLSYTKTL